MQTWLWIIGVVAVVWPLVIGKLVMNEMQRGFQQDNHNDNVVLEAARQLRDGLEKKIADLLQTIREQDKLIAALWFKTYDVNKPSLEEAERLGYSKSAEWPLREAFGLRPEWHFDAILGDLKRDIAKGRK